jgi:hypothetical protein
VPGVEPEKHFRELMIQVPLVMQQLEAAIREELEITTEPPKFLDRPAGPARGRSLLRRPRPVAADESRTTG